jgi:uncharacterized RmlC-like cupin family protein
MTANAQSCISIVSPQAFDAGTSQTPGSERLAAISASQGIVCPMWGGVFVVAPGGKTGIHHHGEQDTIAYVLAGTCLVRWGERGEFTATAHAGDFLHVPAWLPHMEINPSSTEPFRWVVVRSTATPIVVNLPNDYWEPSMESARALGDWCHYEEPERRSNPAAGLLRRSGSS